MPQFDNLFCRSLPQDPEQDNSIRQVQGALWSAVEPTACSAPSLIAYSPEMMRELGLSVKQLHSAQWLAALSGNGLVEGMRSYATCYGGHQFGHWAGQLGDGRAIFLGELLTAEQQRWELQLKGAGATPYARSADGRAVLRSSLREFLCSEAMHHLGIPTTRALSLCLTGEQLERDMFYDGNPQWEPGAIVCRVAPSFTRFGHFELLASRNQTSLLKQLADFTIARDFADDFSAAADTANLYSDWYAEICRRTARMIAHWMRCGFVHGVMNTDNMSILGLTIDYGPYGWLENFDPLWTPNTTDADGRRYCFGRQALIARWNLERLGLALLPLIGDNEALKQGLSEFERQYNDCFCHHYRAKLGFLDWREEDGPLLEHLFKWMQLAEIDLSDFFRRLAHLPLNAAAEQQCMVLQDASYDADKFQAHQHLLVDWLQAYLPRLPAGQSMQQRRAMMNAVNPRYVLRNYLAQEAIELATAGDYSQIHELLAVMKKPYQDQPGREHFAKLRPDWAKEKAGCSMLSCSS